MAGQDAAEGTPFGRYRLIKLLGRGGMGEVWRAHDSETDRIVAIKVLPASLSEDEDFQRRFRREAHAAARLNSPHVIPIHHYGEIDGRLYVDMRLVEGRDLQTVLSDGPLEPARAVRIIEQVAIALHAAHKVGLLHRDIKPSNILLDENDFAYLIDFGIARTIGETRMTQTGSAIGTFQYIAPERLAIGADEDARADIYSLACVLYECLTGGPPFAGDTMPQLVAAHLSAPPPRPSINQAGVPPEVDEVIATGMAKDPNERYATTIELADAARDAITVPIQRPAPAPTAVPPTQQARGRVPAQPPTVKAESVAPAKPPRSVPPIPITAGGISRRTTITLIGGGAVAAIAAAVGIPALTRNHPSQSSQASSSSRTSPVRSYGAQVVLPFTGLKISSVAVDTAANVYVAGYGDNRVLKLPAGSSSQEVLPFTFTGLHSAYKGGSPDARVVAVDAAGSVYVIQWTWVAADDTFGRVVKLPAGSSSQEALPLNGVNHPVDLAVDAGGNLYVNDTNSYAPPESSRVLKLSAGSFSQEVLPFTGLKWPEGIAVDAAGNVYVADSLNNRVVKLRAGSSSQEALPLTGLKGPQGIAVDAGGSVYVAEGNDSRVMKLGAGSSSWEVLPFTGLARPDDIAVDAAGNVYVADTDNHRVLKLPVQ